MPPLRTAGLHHEVGDHPVELQAVVKPLTGQLLEIGHRLGNLVRIELGFDSSLVRFNRGDTAQLLRRLGVFSESGRTATIAALRHYGEFARKTTRGKSTEIPQEKSPASIVIL